MNDRVDASRADYYDRLGVRPSASAEEIRTAYREQARATHPDRNPEDPKAAERFQAVKQAYRVLSDPQRRARYDDTRAVRQQIPEGLTINQQAPAGCGGYVWRVLAGMVAFGLFLALEAMGVWATSSLWTIAVAVTGSSVAAGAIAILVARLFPDEATDVMVRLTPRHVMMRADGHTTFQAEWGDVRAVVLLGAGRTMEVVLNGPVGHSLRPVPPVLTRVEHRSDHSILRLDLSDTDVPRPVLLSFLRTREEIPFPSGDSRDSARDPRGRD